MALSPLPPAILIPPLRLTKLLSLERWLSPNFSSSGFITKTASCCIYHTYGYYQARDILMRTITAVSRQLWWEVARACPYATFFHTPCWTEIACAAIPAVRDRTIAVFLPSGVRAILPLLEVRHNGPCIALLSTFEGCYGGIIADGPLTAVEAAHIYRLVYRWNVTSFAYLTNPLAPPETIDRTYRIGDEIAHIIRLDSDFETLFDRFSRNARGNYRRGLREGARMRRAHTIADWQAYYAAYRDAVHRWGKDETYGYP